MHPWQRQPGENPDDFIAFAVYLRLKGRRSHRAAAVRTGRSLAAIRRLSAQFNWPGRVDAFEARLADATQDALDSVFQRQPAAAQANLEQLRVSEFMLAHRVIHESNRWLKLAADPRRRQLSLIQICRLMELAFYLKRLAAGMPTGDEPRRRRKEDMPGYWTGPSFEEAMKKMYGSSLPTSSTPPGSGRADNPLPGDSSGRAGSPLHAAGCSQEPLASRPPDNKRDLIPHALVVGPHGLLCLQRSEEGECP